MSYVHDHNSTNSKLDPHALKCVFLGYSPSKKGYKCYHPPSKKYLVSLDVTFAENQPYYQHTLQGENLDDEEDAVGGSMGSQETLGTLPVTTL